MYKIKINYESDFGNESRRFFTELPFIPVKNSLMNIKGNSGLMDYVLIINICYVLDEEDKFQYIEVEVSDD
jgi:hypothetical protein